MKEKISEQNKVLTVIGIVLCVILVPILIVNCTLIVKSMINKDEVPTFAGVLPLIVLTDSMYPEIKNGDVIVCYSVEADDVEVGQVISFFDPEGNGTTVVTHKVIEILYDENGARSFRTQGTNNNTPDDTPVPEANLVGRFTGIRVPFLGNIALFMQTTTGLIVCVVVPIILLVGYDIIRRKIYEKNKTEDVDALRAEWSSCAKQLQCRMERRVKSAESKMRSPSLSRWMRNNCLDR